MSKINQEAILMQIMNTCQHFTGIQNGQCKAEVVYSALPSVVIPCTQGGKFPDSRISTVCPSWSRTTRDQALRQVEGIEKRFGQMVMIQPLLEKWRNKEPIGKTETVECPICKGLLHLNQSDYNGHVHGHCETAGCVKWME